MNIVALDISAKSLEVAKQKGVYRQVVCSEVGEEIMPFKDSKNTIKQNCSQFRETVQTKLFPKGRLLSRNKL